MNNELGRREFKGQLNLAVIMVTGGFDLGARINSDRQWTLDLIERDRNFMREQCEYFQGQVLKFTGDGLLACFGNALDAVSCALEIQNTFIRAAATMQPRDLLSHSIGIHIGNAFIREDEVVGDVVAIASRLQFEVNHNTIGISQSIYDAIRNALPISISYIGLKEVKDIQQSIQAYQINPNGSATVLPNYAINDSLDIDSIDINSIETNNFHEFEEYLEPSKELFDEVVYELENHYDVVKVKQLIFYACLNRWESDVDKLDRVNLKGLIQELIEQTSTFKQLKLLMADLIQTISFQIGSSQTSDFQATDQEYGAIADVINSEVGKLYPDYAELEPQDIYDEVVLSLEDPNKDVIRIKKLIYYICKESSPDPSGVVNLKSAIQELRNLYQNLENLRNRLKEVASATNQSEYNEVVDIIVDDLSNVYPARSSVPLSPAFPPILNTNLPTFISSNIVSKPQNPVFVESKLESEIEFKPQISVVEDIPQPPHELNIAAPVISPKSRTEIIAKMELFDLRLEIIKYLSPLRAKILIFAALNDSSDSTSDTVSVVRTYEFDDLIRDLFYAFKSTVDLEDQLKISAKRFKDSEEYTQAVSVIMNAIKPIYEKLL